jgi:hypothetical protein
MSPIWFVAGGKAVAQSNFDVIQLWETDTGCPLPPLLGHRGSITAGAVSTRKPLFASASYIDQTVVVWNTERVLRRQCLETLDSACLEFLWEGLAEKSYHRYAYWVLAAYPRQTVVELKRKTEQEKLMSAEAPSLVRKLGDAEFTVREAAHKRLEEIGVLAVPALKGAAEDSDDTEARARIQSLLKTFGPEVPLARRRAENVQQLLEELAGHPARYPWVVPARMLRETTGP